MKVETVEEAWDYLIEYVGVSESALKLVTNINGYSMDTLESVLYSETGYRNFQQLIDEDEE